MSDIKKVLVVDDHFEMLEFLRSMLELAEHDYEVMAVPSAEEGMLELRRTPFDLLITDVRLPGMSGFDLVRRAKANNPDLPVIMITAYSSEQGRKEASDLGVYRYFTKPLDTDDVLAAINTLLYGEPETAEATTAATTQLVPQLDIVLPDGVRKRLETLSQDTAAAHVMLATVHGQVLLQVGRGRDIDASGLSLVIAQNLQNSLSLTTQLGGDDLSTIQYYSGDDLELYTANIGPEYFMTIVFEVQVRRGRFGTIWVFAQRAIKDLLPVLPSLSTAVDAPSPSPTPTAPPKIAPTPPPSTRSSRRRSSSRSSRRQPATPPPPDPKPEPEPEEPRRRRRPMRPKEEEGPRPSAPPPPDFFVDASTDEVGLGLDDAAADIDVDELAKLLGSREDVADGTAEADDSWEAAAEAEEAGQSAMSFEDAMKMGLIDTGDMPELQEPGGTTAVVNTDIPDFLELDDTDSGELDGLLELDPGTTDQAVDLDSFWDDAIDESNTSGSTGGMSFAEAREKGLIPGEIDFTEESESK